MPRSKLQTETRRAAIRPAFLASLPAALLLGLVLVMAGCSEQPSVEKSAGTPAPLSTQALVFPGTGAYTGAYIDFGATEDDVSLEAIEKFETLVDKHQAVIASSSFWGQQSFPRKNVELISRHGSIPLIFWSPWDKPYLENRPPDRFSLHDILAGKWNNYIDMWADEARAYGKPLLVSWGLEMNGSWFPWSGVHYAGGQPDGPNQSQSAAGPKLYKKAYRYVVGRVKARGARQVLWIFHANNRSFPPDSWNAIAQYYPGADVVDLLGLSVYNKLFSDAAWVSLPEAMDSAYQELCRLDPQKPLIVAEWGVGEFPGSGDKSAWLTEAFAALKTRYPRVKAAVYWHERWQNQNETHSNLRVNSSPEALSAYRQGIADQYWHGSLLDSR